MSWEGRPLSACIEKVSVPAKVPRKSFLASGPVPIVSQEADFINGYWENEADAVKVSEPLVVFGDHTQVLKLIDFDFVVGADGVKLLKPKQFLDARFLKYFLEANPFPSLGYARHYRHISNLEVPLPPIQEQERIVAVLDQAFAALDRARANAEANLADAGELFETYLGSLFQNAVQGWETGIFADDDLLQIIDGDRGKNYPKKADFQPKGDCLFLSTKNVRPNGFEFSDLMFISQAKSDELSKGRLSRRDVILTTRGTIGNIGLFDHTVPFDDVRINSGMLILRPNEERLTSDYLFCFLQSQAFKEQVEKHVSGAAQPQLPIKSLKKFSLPMPSSLGDQTKIVQAVEHIERLSGSLSRKYVATISDIEDLGQSILQKAFAGELT